MAKKAIMCILIFILLFNIVVPNRVVATGSAFTYDDFKEIDESGTVRREGTDGTTTTQPQQIKKSENENGANFTVIGTVLTSIFLPLPLLTQALLSLAIMPEDITKVQFFTIEDMLLRKI